MLSRQIPRRIPESSILPAKPLRASNVSVAAPCFVFSLWRPQLKIGTELAETYRKNISKIVDQEMRIFHFLNVILVENTLHFGSFQWKPKRDQPRAPNCTHVPPIASELESRRWGPTKKWFWCTRAHPKLRICSISVRKIVKIGRNE